MNKADVYTNFKAGAAIEPYRIVKFDSDDDTVIQAAAATDGLIGVADELGADASGDRIDIAFQGIVEVKAGGAVTRGDLLTADATGKAIPAAPGAGINNRVIGTALNSGVLDDRISVHIAPGQIQG